MALLTVFGALAWKVHVHPDRFGLDLRFDNALRGTLPDRHHRAMNLVAALGGPVAMGAGIALMAALSWRAGDRRRLKLSLLGPGAAIAASLIAKPMVGRLLGYSFSFPSGHTTAAAALAATALVVGFDLLAPRHHRRPMWLPVLWPRRDIAPPTQPAVAPPTQPARYGKAAVVAGVGFLAAALMAPVGVALAVVVLRWHVISDSVGGLLLGPAMVAVMTALCTAWVPVDRPAVPSVALRRLSYVGLATLFILAGSVRLPYFILRPGSLIPLNQSVRVEIEDSNTPSNGVVADQLVRGTFSGLTVRTVRLTFGEWFWHDVNNSLDPIVTLNSLIPPGVNGGDYRQTQLRVFVDAGQIAAAVAQTALGEEVVIEGDGVLITAVQQGSPADGHLAVDEVITGLDNREVRSEQELRQVLADLARRAGLGDTAPGTAVKSNVTVPVELTVVDPAGVARTESVTLTVLAGTGRLGLGLGITTQGLRFELPIGVSIEGGDVGGPSAGLLTALTVYDALSPADLANGRHIAGTGTLSLDGRVGPIGAVTQKVLGAIAANADVMLVPTEQAEEARYVAGGRIEVVGVATFDEAVTALTALTATPR